MARARNRLFIDEITSVGAVAAGDNEEAEITFWKKRDVEKATRSERAAQLLERLIAREVAVRAAKRGVPAGSINRAAVLDHLIRDEHSAASKAYRSLLDATDDGDALAILKGVDTESLAAAKQHRRNLEDTARTAMREHLATKEAGMPTIKEAVIETVNQEAIWKHARGYGAQNRGYTIEQAKSEVWQSPIGMVLADLQRSEVADMSVTEAKASIYKSKKPNAEAITKAIETLERGFPPR